MKFYQGIYHYFDKLEDRVRGRLSRYPIIYTLIGGTAIVLFWRGVWITADQLAYFFPSQLLWLDGPLSVVTSVFILLITGLFVSFFVNDQIILSGIKLEKKLAEKTELEVKEEAQSIDIVRSTVEKISKEVDSINDIVSKKAQ